MDMKRREENEHHNQEVDHGIALQRYLDKIQLTCIESIKHSPALELKVEDSVKEAIDLLYEKNVCGALIADTESHGFLDRYIGFIAFSDMVFWCLEEYEKEIIQNKGEGSEEIEFSIDLYSILEECPRIAQTKIAELAKSFLWQPFFPVHMDDTLFHVMLLLSKHRVTVIPVIDRSTSRAMGFITQNAVIQALLQSSGLEWFDQIADKALSNFRIENEECVVRVYRDQNMDEAFRTMRKTKSGIIAIIDRGSEKIIGSLRNNDAYIMLESKTLLRRKKVITVEEFLHWDANKRGLNSSPVTNKKTDTLKLVMENMAQHGANFSFLVDESQRAVGVIGFRDVMIQFSPPCMDARIKGGDFFEYALEQTGCHVDMGSIVVCEQ